MKVKLIFFTLIVLLLGTNQSRAGGAIFGTGNTILGNGFTSAISLPFKATDAVLGKKNEDGTTHFTYGTSSQPWMLGIYKAMIEAGQNDAINVMQGGEASEMFKKVREIVEKQTGISFQDDEEAAVYIIESLE